MTQTAFAAVPAHRAPVEPPRAGRWATGVAGTAVFGNVFVVVILWAIHAGGGDRLTSLGRLTGLLSAVLLLVQVVLMARVPWLERGYGQDRLARWHRLAGFASFHLLLVHVGLTTIGYAAGEDVDVVRETWDLVTTYPGMLLATAALGLFCLVVVTSVRAARRRLRYESWHLLHLYAYLGVALALPHELWTGADFAASPLARAYWWTTYVLAAGSVLVFRIGVPVWRSARHRLVVERVVPEAPGVVSVYMRGRRLDRLPASAGQFLLWRFLDGSGWTRANPYSLSARPARDRLRITVKDLGDGSRRAARLRPGTRVLVEGPYGRLTTCPDDRRPVTMLACGVGVTPLRALLDELVVPVTLLYRARDERDLVFRSELGAAQAAGRLRLGFLLGPRGGDGSWLPAGYPSGRLRAWVPGIEHHHVYVCGPKEWTDAAIEAVREAGVPRERIHTERFDW
jgi:ferredoxin-NADP reductase/DMSO/TMAO reductase YedYZ heme-binding membrane subunit